MRWKAFLRFAILTGLIFVARTSYAAGGTCPSTANIGDHGYAAPTNCYYVDFANGSDSSYDGTQETVSGSHGPLQHAPGMTGCASNCASITPAAGMGFIFKGGVTWTYAILPWTWTWSGSGGNDSTDGCTGASCIYLGVDHSWYTGSSWARPIISGGDWSNPGTNTTCYYDMDAGGAPPALVNYSNQGYIILDNFEITGLCQQSPTGQNPAYIGGGGSSAGNNTVENCYIHRAAWPLSYANTAGYKASGFGTPIHWTYNVVDFTDSGPTTTYTNGGQGYYTGDAITGSTYWVDHNVFYNLGDSSDINPVEVHDNYYYNAAANTGESGFHSHISNDQGCPAGYTLFYDNVIDTANAGQELGFGDYIACKIYIFNNVSTNQSVSFFMFLTGQNGNQMYIFNNTCECGIDSGGGSPAQYNFIKGGGSSSANYYFFNNHVITSAGAGAFQIGTGTCGPFCPNSNWTTSAGTTNNASFNSLPGYPIVDIPIQTQTAANNQGYKYTQTYEFSPTSGSGATVGVGVNETSYCNAIYTLTGDSVAQNECEHDTTYAVGYNTTNHTVVSSGRTPIARPSTGGWDAGAYQFGGSVSGQPNAPTDLSAVVN